MAQTVPGGFGGLYQDFTSNKLVILLKDLSETQESRAALLQVLGCQGAYPGWLGTVISLDRTEYRQARHTGLELQTYLQALESLKEDTETWGLELDPELQSIWIGTSTQAAAARAQSAVAARSVPADAVIIEPPQLTNGPPSFEVTTTPVRVTEWDREGVFSFSVSVKYTNLYSGPRYPDQCVSPDPSTFVVQFKGNLERWNGSTWALAHEPICAAILLQPRTIPSGQSATDELLITGSRLINVLPWWHTARVTGTYRFVGDVYRATMPDPIYVTDLAPLAERTSGPFRIIRTARF